MGVLSVVSFVGGFVGGSVGGLAGLAVGTIAVGINFLFSGHSYRSARYGWRGQLYYLFGIIDTDNLQKFHWNINFWSKEEAVNWRNSYSSACASIAVAAAIFASIGLTSLQLPSMNETHWVARAFLCSSMALGVMSLSSATVLQISVLNLANHIDIRLWLSKGSSNHQQYVRPYNGLLLESSASTLAMLEAPVLFLRLSVLLYLVGFGLYFLYGWKYKVESPSLDDRNIFIFYTVVLCATGTYLTVLFAGQLRDQSKWSKEYDLNAQFDTGVKTQEHELLERWVQTVEEIKEAPEAHSRYRLTELHRELGRRRMAEETNTSHNARETNTPHVAQETNTPQVAQGNANAPHVAQGNANTQIAQENTHHDEIV